MDMNQQEFLAHHINKFQNIIFKYYSEKYSFYTKKLFSHPKYIYQNVKIKVFLLYSLYIFYKSLFNLI